MIAAPVIAVLATACTNAALYSGTLQTTAGTCDSLAAPSLELRGATAVFSPDNGVLVLTGHRAADGAIEARLSVTGADGKPYRLAFVGALHGRTVTGTYATPHCRAAVALHPITN